MKANLIKGTSVDSGVSGGGRSVLSKCIPLDTPYTIIVCPIYACNFRCRYCMYSLPECDRSYVPEIKRLGIESCKKMIDDMTAFPQKVKVLNFCGLGEPLLEPELPNMIRYAVEKQVANVTEVISNGMLLSHEMSERLASSGLTRLKISIQGLDSETYQEFSQIKIDFDTFVEQIRYFYEHRKNVKLYLKIMDAELKGHSEQEFFDIFGDICDDISIEHLIPASEKIDYHQLSNDNFSMTMNGNCRAAYRVCPRPFFVMNVHSDGNVDPCCTADIPVFVGNVKKESIVDIWNGKKANAFRKMQLIDKGKNEVCRKCTHYQYVMFEEDNLDDVAEEMIDKF